MRPKEKFAITEPAKCTRMSKEETEYDGGFFWHAICAAVSVTTGYVAPVVTKGLKKANIIDSETEKKINLACTVVSVITGYASGMGTLLSAKSTTLQIAKAAIKDCALSPGKAIVQTGYDWRN